MGSTPTPTHPRLELLIEVYEPLAVHRRTVFMLSTPGSNGSELRLMMDSRPAGPGCLPGCPPPTLRERHPDVRFVQLYAPQLPGRRTDKWFSTYQLERFDIDRRRTHRPDLSSVVQAVVDVVLREHHGRGITAANMVLCGTGQAATVALGVVLALGAKAIRYVGIEGGVPLQSRLHRYLNNKVPMIETALTVQTVQTTAPAATPDLGIYNAALFFRAQLALHVPLTRPADYVATGTMGGLLWLLFRARPETAQGRATRRRAERVLQTMGYTIRTREATSEAAMDDNLSILYACLGDTLTWMRLDDGAVEPVDTGRYRAAFVNPNDVHYRPVTVPEEEKVEWEEWWGEEGEEEEEEEDEEEEEEEKEEDQEYEEEVGEEEEEEDDEEEEEEVEEEEEDDEEEEEEVKAKEEKAEEEQRVLAIRVRKHLKRQQPAAKVRSGHFLSREFYGRL